MSFTHDCPAHEHADQWPVVYGDREVQAAAGMFRVLGDPARLRLLELLAHGERCVSEIAAQSQDEISTVSQRLKVLRGEHLITRRRAGKHIYYGLVDQHVMDMVRNALAHAGEHFAPNELEEEQS